MTEVTRVWVSPEQQEHVGLERQRPYWTGIELVLYIHRQDAWRDMGGGVMTNVHFRVALVAGRRRRVVLLQGGEGRGSHCNHRVPAWG